MTIKQLELQANEVRQDIIKMLLEAGSGHSAGPLGMADVFTALYFEVLNHRPKDPDWPGRDRLILSNGHIVPVRYATMARAGYFPVKELMTLRQFGSRLQGHPERVRLPGLETTSGPLGSGLSQAAGLALALRMDDSRARVYCVSGDGEQDEGNFWEAAMFAAKYKLSNLTLIVDRNNIQIDGTTEQVMPLENLAAKWQAFGWHVVEIDGHNMQAIIDACHLATTIENQPVAIIAHTIPGKGVDFMENDFHYHGYFKEAPDAPGDPSKEERAKVALHELRTLGGRIRSEHNKYKQVAWPAELTLQSSSFASGHLTSVYRSHDDRSTTYSHLVSVLKAAGYKTGGQTGEFIFTSGGPLSLAVTLEPADTSQLLQDVQIVAQEASK
jgi:transketolase